MRIGKRYAAGVTAAALVALSGCAVTGSDSSAKEERIQIAYLTASSANTWLGASGEAMRAEAEKAGVKIVEFDAKFEPGASIRQIQDVIASGQYKGIVIATSDGKAAAPAMQEAMDAGLKVVVLNQVVGDRLDTADPQVEGLSASILQPPQTTGERLGKLTVQACEGVSPCKVVYMYGAKGTPYDTALRTGFDSQISAVPGITVVAEADGGFLGTDEPMKATQDVLQAHPDFDVLAGTGDQQIRGALLALTDAGKTGVKTIGVGGSEPALKAIADGTWWGDVAGAPADEGRAAFQALMAAIKDGTETGGVDVTSDLTDDGLITRNNVDKFTAQWAG
ncbi:MAG: putative ABC-type sugar transport system periplasmic component-like protein [Blastococcus sp.]|nr:putative ABC-type sugar transport system periplasmic component-like protein [Blastococcus sp.]